MKSLLIVAALILLAVGAFKLMSSSAVADKVGDPVTTMIGTDLKFKAQAEITLRLTTLQNQMRQQMAAGAIDAVVAKPVLDELDRLHADVDDTRRKLTTLGDTPAQVDAWLARLQWDEFQRTEEQFRKMAAN